VRSDVSALLGGFVRAPALCCAASGAALSRLDQYTVTAWTAIRWAGAGDK